jgi:hypothetical protein
VSDVVECGRRAFIFYFTHPGLAGAADEDSYQARRSCVLAAELRVEDDRLTCDRNAPPAPPFLPAKPAVSEVQAGWRRAR